MVDEITYICKNLDKRSPGSEGEKQACEYMAKVRGRIADATVCRLKPQRKPRLLFWLVYFTITAALLAIACYFFFPLASIILLLGGLFICFMQFGLYKKLVDPVFPEKTGP